MVGGFLFPRLNLPLGSKEALTNGYVGGGVGVDDMLVDFHSSIMTGFGTIIVVESSMVDNGLSRRNFFTTISSRAVA